MTSVVMNHWVQKEFTTTHEWSEVIEIAEQLHAHLNTSESLSQIRDVNRPGRSSADIQHTFSDFARQLGFESEKKGLFAGTSLALRPDYYRSVQGSGIILEVERGKTTINNMDLLDFWKCHLCPAANYLFLLVPLALRQNATMRPRNEFATVERRLSEFFRADNYTNVRGLCLFGY